MKPTRIGDILKVTLNTLVLVTSGVGSIVNLARGNSLPFALCLIVVLIFLVVIVSELRRTTAAEPAPEPARPAPVRPHPVARPAPARPAPASPAFALEPGHPLLLRLVRVNLPASDHAGNTPA